MVKKFIYIYTFSKIMKNTNEWRISLMWLVGINLTSHVLKLTSCKIIYITLRGDKISKILGKNLTLNQWGASTSPQQVLEQETYLTFTWFPNYMLRARTIKVVTKSLTCAAIHTRFLYSAEICVWKLKYRIVQSSLKPCRQYKSIFLCLINSVMDLNSKSYW